MKHVFDHPGFKKYLLTEEGKFKEDGMSIWFNMIPIPLDLFDRFFDSWRDYFALYLDHLMVSIILANNINELTAMELSFDDFPTDGLSLESIDDLKTIIANSLNSDSTYQLVGQEISNTLGVEGYIIELSALMNALAHKGKKYERLFMPRFVRTLISRYYPRALDKVATRNGDMFGNIIADGIGLYRAGFGDALSALFNKLLDYKIDKCSGIISLENSVKLRFESSTDCSIDDRVLHIPSSDGCLWQPFFDGDVKMKLNPNHPFYKTIADSGNPQAIFQMLLKLSEFERNSSSNRELELLENFRRNLSRGLLDN
ncbi:hypothetical protein N8087_05565 [Porticoccaceae bacterium]|nr:hypothetical protein [Porticoccaceae bacterium]